MKALACVLLAGALGACFKPVFNNPRCGPNGECPPGTECVDGLCVGDIAFDASDTDGALDDGATSDGLVDAAPDAPPGPQPFAGCQASPDLMLCYRFESSATLLQDGSTFGSDGTSPQGVTPTTGRVGTGAIMFSGGNSGFNVPPDPQLNMDRYTIEMWINLGAPPPGGGRWGILDKDLAYGMFYYFDGTVRCVLESATAMAPVSLTVGQWTHVACTYDGVAFRFFKNGTLVGTQNMSAPNPINGTPMAIGHNIPSGDYFPGKLDELKIWRRALTPTEICSDAGC